MQILFNPMEGDGGGSAAGDSLASPPPDSGAGAKTITVPSDLMPDCKPGDTYKVQSVADGNVTLEHQSSTEEETSESWGKGLKEAAKPEEGM